MIESILAALGVVIGPLLAGIYKLVGLNTRVALVEQKQQDQLILIDTKLDAIDQRLARIERAMNGHLKGY